jgi:FMN phosphatase YigB (HAD superfamily)
MDPTAVGMIPSLIVAVDLAPSLAVTERWEARLGLGAGEINNRMADVWYGGGIGTISEADVHRALAERFGFDNRQADEFMSWIWREYLGCANTELIEYARRLRPQYRTGILSNSFVGAREREQAAYGFEDLVDEIIYSHECGLSKPDPAIYALTCERLRVAPQEIIFLDDYEPNVEGARQVGIHAVLYKDNAQAVRDIEVLLALSPPETHRPPAARRAAACSRSHVPPVRTRHGGSTSHCRPRSSETVLRTRVSRQDRDRRKGQRARRGWSTRAGRLRSAQFRESRVPCACKPAAGLLAEFRRDPLAGQCDRRTVQPHPRR